MESDEALTVLQVKRAQVLERLRDLDSSVADMVEAARDSNLDDEHDPEGQTIASSRAQVASLARSAQQQLRLIDRAVRRVATGEYGRCVRCGRQIADGRLEALPEVELCIECAAQEGARRR